MSEDDKNDEIMDQEAAGDTSPSGDETAAPEDASFKDKLYQKSEKRKVRGNVTFVNAQQIREIIEEEVAGKEAEFNKKLAAKQKEFDDATERLKMLNKAALFENEELKKKMIDFEKLTSDNEDMAAKLEQMNELFEIKKVYDRMLQLVGQCESPEELKEKIEQLSRENTSLRERISVLERGLEYVGAVNPAPVEKGNELINAISGRMGRMKEKLPENVYREISGEFELDKAAFTESVEAGKDLVKNMEEGSGTVYCIAEIIRNAEYSRALFEKFRLLSKLAGN